MIGYVVMRGIVVMMILFGVKRRCNVERRNWFVGNKRCFVEVCVGVIRLVIWIILDNVMGFIVEIMMNWVW